jgi:hypothetical protein
MASFFERYTDADLPAAVALVQDRLMRDEIGKQRMSAANLAVFNPCLFDARAHE